MARSSTALNNQILLRTNHLWDMRSHFKWNIEMPRSENISIHPQYLKILSRVSALPYYVQNGTFNTKNIPSNFCIYEERSLSALQKNNLYYYRMFIYSNTLIISLDVALILLSSHSAVTSVEHHSHINHTETASCKLHVTVQNIQFPQSNTDLGSKR